MMPLDQMRTSCRAAIDDAEKQESDTERFEALQEIGSALADLISGSLQRAYTRHNQRDLEDETGDRAGFPVPDDREDFHADG